LEEFEVSEEEGFKDIGSLIGELIEENFSDSLVIIAISKLLGETKASEMLEHVKPLIETDAGRAVREMRDRRA
jgi:hypothetical protein